MADAERRMRVRLSIRGRVQGVWFRESTRLEAERLGITGWVMNRSDGSVEAVIEGEAGAVREMEAWCHHGPPSARVNEVISSDEPPIGETRFVVK